MPNFVMKHCLFRIASWVGELYNQKLKIKKQKQKIIKNKQKYKLKDYLSFPAVMMTS